MRGKVHRSMNPEDEENKDRKAKGKGSLVGEVDSDGIFSPTASSL